MRELLLSCRIRPLLMTVGTPRSDVRLRLLHWVRYTGDDRESKKIEDTAICNPLR